MAHEILARLQQARVKAPVDRDQVYDAMMSEIRLKAEDSARDKVKHEVAAANASVDAAMEKVARAEAQLQAAEQLLSAEQSRTAQLESRLKQVSSQIQLEQATLNTKSSEMTNANNELRKRLGDERELNKQLEVKVASLEGQIVSLKKPKPKPKQPVKYPEFKIEDVKRGVDNRITGVTVKPIGLN